MPADSSHQIGQTVGARLRVARLAKKYTQGQLARPDFSVSYISAIERGQIQPSLRALEILAQRLDLSTTDLLPANSAVAGAPVAVGEPASSGNEEREFLLLEARIAIYQKNPARAIELLRGLLPRKGERRHENASELYFILGWAYLAEGRLQECEQLLAEAARGAREAADPLYPSLIGLQSAVYTAMRNTEQAVQLQRESWRVLAHQPSIPLSPFALAQLHSSMAQHYTYLGEYEQAVDQFHQVLAVLQILSSRQQRQESYQQFFNACKEREQYSLAIFSSYKELLADLRSQLPEKKREIEYALGRVLLKSNPEKAHAYLQELVEAAARGQNTLLQAGANIQRATLLLARGETDQAEQLVSQVQQQVGQSGNTLLRADAQILAGELAYKRQDYSAGDSFFEEGLALLEQIGAREELVEQLARYAQLLEERNYIQKSIIYWKRAYENRQQTHTPVL